MDFILMAAINRNVADRNWCMVETLFLALGRILEKA